MSSFLKAIIIGCRILDWQNYFRTSKISSHCLLDAIVSVEKPIQNLILAFLENHVFFFSLAASSIFSLSLIFSNLTMMCLGVVSFALILLRSVISLNLCLIFFINLKNSQALSLQTLFLSHSSLYFFGASISMLSYMYPPCSYDS